MQVCIAASEAALCLVAGRPERGLLLPRRAAPLLLELLPRGNLLAGRRIGRGLGPPLLPELLSLFDAQLVADFNFLEPLL